MEPFIGEIRLFAGTYAPKGWLECGGQVFKALQHPTLFAIIGYTYGGNDDTFALPDLRGRAVAGAGDGVGLTSWPLAQRKGMEEVSLTESNLPPHNHFVSTYASNNEADLAEVADARFFLSRYKVKGLTNLAENFRSPTIPGDTTDVIMAVESIGFTGGSLPHYNMQPYLTLRYCIAVEGIYPMKP